MKRKIAAILLVLCLVVPTGATYLWLSHKKTLVKKEVKKKLISGTPRSELVHLVFKKEEAQSKLKWKHSKEFEYEQEMYDVVETIVHGDTIEYYCWWDDEETILNRQLTQLLSRAWGHHPVNERTQLQLNNFYKSFFPCSELRLPEKFETAAPTAFYWEDGYTTSTHSPPTPPPRG